MSRPGIVADECASAINERDQFSHRARRGRICLAGTQPPVALVGITGDLNLKILCPQMRGKIFVFFQRPDADGLPGTGMDQNGFTAADGGNENFLTRWKFDIQRAGDDAPGFVAVRLWLRAGERLRQENLAADARKTEPIFCADEFQKQMVARIPARGEAEFKMPPRQPPPQADDFQKRPAPEG